MVWPSASSELKVRGRQNSSFVRRYEGTLEGIIYIYTLEGIVLKTLINNIIPSFVMRPIH